MTMDSIIKDRFCLRPFYGGLKFIYIISAIKDRISNRVKGGDSIQ